MYVQEGRAFTGRLIRQRVPNDMAGQAVCLGDLRRAMLSGIVDLQTKAEKEEKGVRVCCLKVFLRRKKGGRSVVDSTRNERP
jgi:hypothetical protein